MAAKADKSRNLARTVTICIALIFIAGGRFIPAPEGLSVSAMQILGIFAGTLIL